MRKSFSKEEKSSSALAAFLKKIQPHSESINLVAHTFGDTALGKGDEVLISEMEHHSNIVPWQMLCERKGCALKVIPMNDAGEIILVDFVSEKPMIGERYRKRLLAGLLLRGGGTWFFKMTGEDRLVQAERKKFRIFLESLKPGGEQG